MQAQKKSVPAQSRLNGLLHSRLFSTNGKSTRTRFREAIALVEEFLWMAEYRTAKRAMRYRRKNMGMVRRTLVGRRTRVPSSCSGGLRLGQSTR